MAKLDHRRGGVYEPDPARVIEVRDSGVWSGDDDTPFETAAQRERRYAANRIKAAKEAVASAQRSEKIRLEQIAKKKAALAAGMPFPPKKKGRPKSRKAVRK